MPRHTKRAQLRVAPEDQLSDLLHHSIEVRYGEIRHGSWQFQNAALAIDARRTAQLQVARHVEHVCHPVTHDIGFGEIKQPITERGVRASDLKRVEIDIETAKSAQRRLRGLVAAEIHRSRIVCRSNLQFTTRRQTIFRGVEDELPGAVVLEIAGDRQHAELGIRTEVENRCVVIEHHQFATDRQIRDARIEEQRSGTSPV